MRAIVRKTAGLFRIDRERYQDIFVMTKMLFDIFAVAFAIMSAFRLSALVDPEGIFPPELRFPVGIWILSMNIVFFWMFGLYRQEVSFLNFEETEKIIKAAFIGHLAVYPGIVLFSEIYPAFLVIAISLCLSIGLIAAERLAAYKIAKRNYAKGRFVRRVAIYDACPAGIFILKKLVEMPQLGYQPIGFIDNGMPKGRMVSSGSEQSKARIPVLGSIAELEKSLKENHIEELFVATPAIQAGEMRKIIAACKTARSGYRFVPNLIEEPLYRINLYAIGNIPFLRTDEFEIDLATRAMKRLIDIVFSAITLALLAPIFALIAVLIKKDSKGPVFFFQERIGKNGLPFTIIKFRTMTADSPAYADSPSGSDDPRITRIGRILRKTSLDELPQFWNVLRNDMSIVGPRPEMPYIVATYDTQQRERLLVKPGITGLWQITLDRSRHIHENLDYDIYYIKNVSVLLDILIMMKTALFAIRGIGAN